MSGGSKTTTQTQSNEPWPGAQPALNTGLAAATDLYKSGNNFKPYTESTVVPYSGQTQQGMNAIEGMANSALSGSNPTAQPLDFLSGLYGQGGLSSDQKAVGDQWRNTASGAELNQTSPAFADVMRQATDAQRDAVNMSMSGAGRYGSGMHTDVLGRSIGDLSSRMLVDEYSRQLGRQDNARSSLAGMGQQGLTNLFGAGEAMPGAWAGAQAPATDLMKLGTMQEDLAGRQMADQQRMFDEQQAAPRSAIEWLNAIGSGAGSLGGTSTSSTTQPGTNPFLQVLAGGVGLNNLFGNPLGGLF